VKNTADVTGGKPIAVLLQSISGVSAINPLVAFYDIHGGKKEVLFVYFVPGTTRVYINSVQLTSNLASLFPTLIPLSGVGITYFHHVMIKIQQLFLRLVLRQPSLKLQWVQTTANTAGTNGLTCLPKHGGA
jgi:hypothetical protein